MSDVKEPTNFVCLIRVVKGADACQRAVIDLEIDQDRFDLFARFCHSLVAEITEAVRAMRKS